MYKRQECDRSVYAPSAIRIFEVAQLQQGSIAEDAAYAGLARPTCKAPEPMFHISRLHSKKVSCHFCSLCDLFSLLSTFSMADSTSRKLFALHTPQPVPSLLLRRSYDFHHAPPTCSETLFDHRCVGRAKADRVRCLLEVSQRSALCWHGWWRTPGRSSKAGSGGSGGVLPPAQAEACICRVGEMPQLVRNTITLCIPLRHLTAAAAASGCSSRFSMSFNRTRLRAEYFPQLM